MITKKLACLFILISLACAAHEPEAGQPAFVRSAVESVPPNEGAKSDDLTLGEPSSFLRGSVESVPFEVISSHLPLRDAVEYRPDPATLRRQQLEEMEGMDDYVDYAAEPSQNKELLMRKPAYHFFETNHNQQSSKYDAFFVVPKVDRDFNTQTHTYRVGSPYQELVQIRPSSADYSTGVEYDDYANIDENNDEDYDNSINRKKTQSFNRKSTQNVLCYMTNWAFYRKGDGQFVPENLDAKLCTHILYSFASLEPETLTIKEFDPWADIDNGLYKRAVNLNKDVPVLLAIGGWTDSVGNKYSQLASSASSRQKFVRSAVDFLRLHGFAGLHFDWNYPVCWQSDCKKGSKDDKPNFTKLIQELSAEFSKQTPPMLLGVAISGYKEVITEAYDVKALSNAADFLTVMTYDYHGAWESQTGHVSPLYGRPSDKYPQYNTDYAMKLLTTMGADREKLILGVPFYGQSFTLSDNTKNSGEGSAAQGPGKAGEFTKQPGMLAYYEICSQVKSGTFKVETDSSEKSGPYAFSKSQWVGYEDMTSIETKAKYVMDSGFGGMAAWTVDLDDFMNRCCGDSFPLLKAINRGLGRKVDKSTSGCERPQNPITPVAPVMTVPEESGIYRPPVTQAMPVQTSPASTILWSPTTSKRTTTRTSRRTTTTTTPKTTTTTTAAETTTSKTTTRRTTRRTKKPTTVTTTTEETAAEEVLIPPPGISMPISLPGNGCKDGEFRPVENNCNAFYRCSLGELIQQYCAGGLHWNSAVMSCDWPSSAMCVETVGDNVGMDQDGVPPVQTASPTRKTTTASSAEYTEAPPKQTSTRKTTRRTTTRKTTTVLSEEYTEAPPKRTTTRPAPSTTKKRRTTHRTSARPAYPPAEDSQVSCVPGQYYSTKSCESYSICVNGILLEQDCASGLQWSQEFVTCDWKENVNCVSTKDYFRLLALTYGGYAKLNADDPCDGQDFVPYPGDCTQYLRCVWGRLEGQSCPQDLHWNQESKACDWPEEAHCQSGDSSNNVEGSEGVDEASNSVDQGNSPDESEEKPDESGEMPEPVSIPDTTVDRPAVPDYVAPEPVDPDSGYYKLVCYFTNWAWYRPGLGKYTPDDINTDLCTHVVYGFAVLDGTSLTIKTHDSWADIDNKFYERVVSLKSKGVRVTVAIGGWNDSLGDKYSRLVRSAAARAKFIRNIVQFIEKYNFEGLDLDWEYPVCWQVDCSKGKADEKEGFADLVKELSAEFKPRGWLLSAAVSPSKAVIDAGYDVPTLAKHFDWIAVMTYDYHGQWDKKTGHVAPLFYHPEDEVDYFNANYTMHYWIKLGAPSRKLVMGMPLYGQAFTLSDAKNNGLNARAPGPGLAGEFTRSAGFLAYYEICDRVKNKGWTVVQDPEGRMGPYAYKGNQWVSFDDADTLRRKSQLVRSMDLGGGMVWALDLDDFKNRCGQGSHPLLKTIRDVLKDAPTDTEATPTVKPEVATPEPDIDEYEELPDTDNEVDTPVLNDNQKLKEEEFKVVCYFTNWAWYRQSAGAKFVPEDIDGDLCSHIVYGFAVLNRDTLTIKTHDSWADIDNKFYERVVEYKKKGIRVTVAIGGWNDSAGDKYSRLVRDASARTRFIKSIVEFIEKWGFEGLDLDWEYPVCWQVDCTKGFEDEKEAFADLVKELYEEFQPRKWLLSAAVSPAKKVIDAGYDIPQLSKYFDWIAVMTYDFHGQWDKKTGHVAPMYEHPEDSDMTFNANFSINYWLSEGADRKKIIMGMPMYGQSFSLADNNKHGLNAATYGGGEAGDGTRARGFLSYYEICQRIHNNGWHVVRDQKGRMGPYAYLGDQWVSFDDTLMIKHKSQYVKAMGIGGAMIWALDLDDFRNQCNCEEYPLLRTINRVLRNYASPDPKCQLETVTEISSGETQEQPNQLMTTKRPTVLKPKPTKPDTILAEPKPTKPASAAGATKRSTKAPLQTARPTKPQAMGGSNKCSGNDFKAHKNCNKYYTCMHGQYLEQSCPPGLMWNADHCDWPYNTDCQQENEIDDSASADVPTKRPTSDKPSTTKRSTKAPKKTTTVLPLAGSATMKPTVKPTSRKPSPTSSRWTTTKRPAMTTAVAKPKPTKPPLPDHPVIVNSDNQYKVVCYFTNWAWYRPGLGKYTPDDINTDLCTHIVYGFAVLNSEALTLKTHDSWADIDNRFYERVVEFKQKGLRVTLALGGWNDSLGNKYSRLVRDPAARARFIKHAIEFIEKYGFEGLDLDWEYPVCWQVDCTKGMADEKENFAAFVRELSEEFVPRGLLLSAAVSPSKMVIDKGYDVPTLAKYFDWIAVMTYDYHGQWDKKTGHVAPLYAYPGDDYDYFNSNFTIRYWIEQGAPPKKLVMGMPMYGQAFSLADPANHDVHAKAPSAGLAGKFTKAAGFLAYYEICEKVNDGGWTVVRDPEGRIGPYAYKGNQWVSYDDVEDIRRKTKFLKDLNLGGGMIWALDLDDFRGKCGCGKHPLLRTMNQELGRISTQRIDNCT